MNDETKVRDTGAFAMLVLVIGFCVSACVSYFLFDHDSGIPFVLQPFLVVAPSVPGVRLSYRNRNSRLGGVAYTVGVVLFVFVLLLALGNSIKGYGFERHRERIEAEGSKELPALPAYEGVPSYSSSQIEDE